MVPELAEATEQSALAHQLDPRLSARWSELLEALDAWSQDPTSDAHLDVIQPRLSALRSAARFLGESDLLVSLSDLEARLRAAAAPDAAWIAAHRSRWNLDTSAPRHSLVAPKGATALTLGPGPNRSFGVDLDLPALRAVLVVGAVEFGDAFRDASRFEVHLEPDMSLALATASFVNPDLVVVDADTPGALEFVRAALDEPRVDPMATIVVGAFQAPGDAAPFIACGVSRALAKPVTSTSLLETANEVLAVYIDRIRQQEPLGDLTVDQLGARLAEEIRRGLCDAAKGSGRSTLLKLGDGSEVLAAVWSAVAQVRELVTLRTSGAVRFGGGPEGAIPMAPWLASSDCMGRRSTKPRQINVARLDGVEVLVADDDSATRWFLGDILRSSGATVREASTGLEALRSAQSAPPDVIVSDVLMPELDGFSLCRAVKTDVRLRDVPVLLLSWKEDLLQRMQELGADADGYLRKEASGATILNRVAEVLIPRSAIRERLSAPMEARGRLDGLSTLTLLSMAAKAHAHCKVTIRDAIAVYEVILREGFVVRACRTAEHGTESLGVMALRALLGVRTGRWAVLPRIEDETGQSRETSLGSLDMIIANLVVQVRAASALITGTRMLSLGRVELDTARARQYAEALPPAMIELIERLAAGTRIFDEIASGQTSPRLLEDVLSALCAHGMVLGIYGSSGVNLLAAQAEHEQHAMRGAPIGAAGELASTREPSEHEVLASGVSIDEDWNLDEGEPSTPLLRLARALSPPPMPVEHDAMGSVAAEPVALVTKIQTRPASMAPSAYAPGTSRRDVSPVKSSKNGFVWAAAGIGFLLALGAHLGLREAPTPTPTAGASQNFQVEVAEATIAGDSGSLRAELAPGVDLWVEGKRVGGPPHAETPLAPRERPYQVELRANGESHALQASIKPGRATVVRVVPR